MANRKHPLYNRHKSQPKGPSWTMLLKAKVGHVPEISVRHGKPLSIPKDSTSYQPILIAGHPSIEFQLAEFHT